MKCFNEISGRMPDFLKISLVLLFPFRLLTHTRLRWLLSVCRLIQNSLNFYPMQFDVLKWSLYRVLTKKIRRRMSATGCFHIYYVNNVLLLLLHLLLLLLTLQPWVGLGLFNNSIPLLSILDLRPPANNFHPLQIFFYLVHPL